MQAEGQLSLQTHDKAKLTPTQQEFQPTGATPPRHGAAPRLMGVASLLPLVASLLPLVAPRLPLATRPLPLVAPPLRGATGPRPLAARPRPHAARPRRLTKVAPAIKGKNMCVHTEWPGFLPASVGDHQVAVSLSSCCAPAHRRSSSQRPQSRGRVASMDNAGRRFLPPRRSILL